MAESVHPLRAYRKAQVPPLTLAALAARLGTSKPNLSRIETGEQPLSIDLARKAAEVCHIPLRDLLPELAREFEVDEAAE